MFFFSRSTGQAYGKRSITQFVDPTRSALDQTEHHSAVAIDGVGPATVGASLFEQVGDVDFVVAEVPVAVSSVENGFDVFHFRHPPVVEPAQLNCVLLIGEFP